MSLMAVTFLGTGNAADGPADTATTSTTGNSGELAKLKAQLEAQQKQIEQLSAMLAAQKKELDQVSASPAAPVRMLPNLGEVASTTAVLPPAPPAPAPRVFDPQGATAPAAEASSPLQLKVGDATIMPVGFMDMTMSFKDKNAGGSLGSSFGSVPFNNTTTGTAKLSEFRFSPQNSRVGFRIDANVKGAHIIGYNEFDFLGTSGGNNLSVTNGAFVPRLRLFWVDVRKGDWEILGGQSWSLLTPNRKGLSALPGDLFYSQATDVNYVVGLTWTRQPGIRFIYHPSKAVAVGLSLENPDQYMGGSSGGGTVVLPSALSGLAGVQLDNQTNVQTIPNLHPDIIVKLAVDPTSHVHFEFAGIERTFKDWDPSNLQYSTKVAGGGSFNGNFELAKNFRLVTNNYWSDGGGRYLFGQAPDLIVRSDGSISPIHSGGFVEGFETTVNKTLLYAYYSGVYVGRNVAVDANGTSLVGYGYRGSANSQNRTIQEITFGFNQTIWKDAKWGALNVMGQYAYIFREPWYVATNAPKAAHDNTIFMNLRYTLPGGAPAAK
jgi:uncharacterized coiled-coil protein SlyX